MHFVDVSSEAHLGLVAGETEVAIDLGGLVKMFLVIAVVGEICKEKGSNKAKVLLGPNSHTGNLALYCLLDSCWLYINTT